MKLSIHDWRLAIGCDSAEPDELSSNPQSAIRNPQSK
jgi:hypothetical protein